jgi:hypothetical protein
MALRLRGHTTFALTSVFELPSLDCESLRDRMIDGDAVSQVLGVPLIREEDPALVTGRAGRIAYAVLAVIAILRTPETKGVKLEQ